MFHASKNNFSMQWQPSISLEALHARATLLHRIRQFFADRKVLEVQTPLLAQASVTDPHIQSISAVVKTDSKESVMYLQTSPEYAMKRLLAAGSGSIYQISKTFRQGDLGQRHQPEFTLLEWYRVGFDHHDLMDEMDALLQCILQTQAAERLTYANAFVAQIALNPHVASDDDLINYAKQHINFNGELPNRNAWLDLLFTHCIEPHLGHDRPVFLYDFPISLAALAKIRAENPPVASRFEVYFKGIELANGFHELQDAAEQRVRFEKDLIYRQQQNLPPIPIDELFLAALHHGLPDCAGVALGVDRLMMLVLNQKAIKDVMFATVT